MVTQVELKKENTLSPEAKKQTIRLENLLNTTEPLVISQLNLAKENIDAHLLMEKVITPLRDVILNVEYLWVKENHYLKTSSGRYIIPRLVNLFNDAILLVNKAKPSLIDEVGLMQSYKEILLWDCDQKLRGSCEFIRFFKFHDSPNMSQIAKMIHDRETEDEERLRIIKVGFELKNNQLDSSLRFLLLQRVTGSLSQENHGTINLRRKRQDIDLFTNTLKISSHDFHHGIKYIDLIKSLNPWSLSRNVEDAKSPAMTNIIDLASRHILYDDQGNLSHEIKTTVFSPLLYIVGRNDEQGFEFQRRNIRGELKERYEQYVKSKDKASSQEEKFDLRR